MKITWESGDMDSHVFTSRLHGLRAAVIWCAVVVQKVLGVGWREAVTLDNISLRCLSYQPLFIRGEAAEITAIPPDDKEANFHLLTFKIYDIYILHVYFIDYESFCFLIHNCYHK
ncbi:MAG: hypothetical protein IJP56_03180 [Synergistaceae bacterium]|nr:hypothetical protein [Synergistaceae bacterium]